ncbi:hypothetical protein GN244_ATG16872 [Phytophthora infestans]|nr:hypothetical protein GN244_ATG16872 [Phytophthora infestans]
MPRSQKSGQTLERPASSSSLSCTAVFPPLPPLPPPDTSKWTEPMRKTSSLPPASVSRSEPRPRRFGTKITNLLSAGDGSLATYTTDHKSPAPIALATAQRYYHQSQNPGKKPCAVAILEDENCEMKPEFPPKDVLIAFSEYITASKNDIWVSAKSSESTLPRECSFKTNAMRTIWSVTPDELTELTEEVAAMKKDSAEFAKKLSYAEASKRNLPGSIAISASQKMEAVEDEQLLRPFKKYFGLPIVPCYESSLRNFINALLTCTSKLPD